jgi:hypothetical protein
MAQRVADITIEGQTPLLVHAYPLVRIEAFEKKTPEEQATLALYLDPEGQPFFPGINVQRALIAGAVYSKGKGRASLQKPAAACVFVQPERLPLGGVRWQVDARPVVVPATKGRVVRYRPRFDAWHFNFQLEWDDALIRDVEMRCIVDDTGQRVGIGDFRPERKGPYGRFTVVAWQA